MPESRIINGVKVNAFRDFDHIIDCVYERKAILIALNSDKLYYCQDNLKSIINNNIGYCDGIGAVWALKRKGIKNVKKIAGCELWLEVIKNNPYGSFYFVGAEESVIKNTIQKLKIEFPNINIVGYRNGFIKDDDERYKLIEDIVIKKPSFLFVAMGSPKQEYLLNEIHKKINIPMMGLGGSFNVYTGKVKRAPKWMLKLNLETLYRYFFASISFKRVKSDWKFLYLLLMNKI